jgi:phospholipid/cholesterol/gamma-HCH transport system substrate-binding protein
MNPEDDRRRAGTFVLVSFGLLAVLLGILAGVRFLSRDKVYLAEFRESVAGLEPSSPVKYNGVPVGTVTAIRFDPKDLTRILVEFKVSPEVPIKVDTRALLQPQGITGISYLELHGGTTAAEDLPVGGTIPSDPSFSTKIASIAKNVSELALRLNNFVEKNEENLSYAIADFRASAGSIRSTFEKVDRMVASAEEMLKGGARVVDEGRLAVEEARKAIADLRAEAKGTGESLRGAAASFEEVMRDPALRALPEKANRTLDLVHDQIAGADLRGLVGRVDAAVTEFRAIEESLARAASALALTAEDGRRDVGAALADIRLAAGHVKEATRLLKEDPGRLLRSRPASDKEVPDPMPPLPEDRR